MFTRNTCRNTTKPFNSKKSITLSVYTESAWFKTNSHKDPSNYSDYLNYIETNHPVKRAALILKKIKNTNPDVSSVNLTLIDDNYFSWLNKNNLSNSEENRVTYMNSLSEKRRAYLWSSNKLNFIYDSYLIPINLFSYKNKEDNISLTNSTISSIKKSISKKLSINKIDIYVSPYAYRADYLAKYTEELLFNSTQSLNNKKQVNIPKLPLKHTIGLIENNNVTKLTRFVLVTIKSPCNHNLTKEDILTKELLYKNIHGAVSDECFKKQFSSDITILDFSISNHYIQPLSIVTES